MQLSQINRSIISSGNMEVAKATIKASRKVFDMFSDQTYGNKPVAICRELVANGIDAHIAAGTPNVPVEVTMPTELEPEFKVKDQGIGMAHDFVMGPFMAYTDGSTKDKSNDQIGGFGIGSKSPFAYCDQFTLRVVHEGVLSVYTMFKDEEGIPSIGLNGQTTTDEHNGVEVSFPVESDDMEDFRSAAQTALQYFHPLPLVNNGELSAPDYSHVSSTGKWAMRPQSGALGVIMGGVRYPVNTDSLPWAVRRDQKAAPLLDYGIDITLPIGACDVAMSREALSYTDKTSKSITDALAAIVDEVAATFATLFDSQPNKWSAQKALWKELTNLSGGRSYSTGGRVGMLRQYAQYKGKPLAADVDLSVKRDYVKGTWSYIYPQGYPEGASAWTIIEYSHRSKFPSSKFQTFGMEITSLTPGGLEVVFYDDMNVAPKSRLRSKIEHYLKTKHPDRSKNSLVLRARNNEDKKEMRALLSFLGDPKVVLTSTLEEPPRVFNGGGTTGPVYVRPKVRMFTFNGQNDTTGSTITNLAPGHYKRDAVKEIAYADQPTTGILVVLDGWALPADFRKKMRAGLIQHDELLFVLQGDAKKLKGGSFLNFDEVFNERFEKEKNKYPDLSKWLAVADASEFSDVFSRIEELRQYLNLTPAQLKTPFGKLVTLYDENVVPLTQALRGFAVNANIAAKMPSSIKPVELVDAFKTKQPFAVHVLELIRYGSQTQRRADLLVNNL